MSLILFFVFSILLLGLVFIITIIKGIASFLFGRSNSSTGRGGSHSYDRGYTQKGDSNSDSESKKIFSKDEGEYVSFEEVKD